MKKLAILGSTGSIGTQALEVAAFGGWEVTALAANSNIELLEQQIRQFKPKIAAVADEKAAAALKIKVADTATRVESGTQGVCLCAGAGADIVLNAVVGIAGLAPTMAAIQSGAVLALANKESLVTGGELVMKTARERGVPVLPVDSEHSAIFQSLQGCTDKKEVKRLILTASGGPFFGKTKAELENVTVAEALNHPNWSMGAKITVDSATMMNKGLELIEARWLFDVKPEDIDILVHRQSVVHSLVEYCDNSVIAQLGVPDMRIPIQYALTYPARVVSPVRQLRLEEYATLTFSLPDYDTFPCINLSKRAIQAGGLYPAALNGANEMANALFRKGELRFPEIAETVAYVLDSFSPMGCSSLNDIFEADKAARSLAAAYRRKG